MLRPARSDGDLAAVVALRERLDPLTATTVADQRVFLAQARAPCVLIDDGVAFAQAMRFPGEGDGTIDIGVVPERRGAGIGGALLARLEEHARAQRWPALLAASTEEEGVAWLERRGFAAVDTQERVVLELGPVAPEPSTPSGLALTDLATRPDLGARLHGLGAEVMADIPGALAAEGIGPLDAWLAQFDAPSRREDFVVIALDRDAVAGWAQLNVYPRVGYHDLTAVARTHRRRGVARALKQELIRRAHARGLERLLTNSNSDNTAMRALNAELGYRPVSPRVYLRRSTSTG